MRSHILAQRATTKYFLTRLFSKRMLKKKDFQEIARLAWAREVRGSNPRAPTKKITGVFSSAYKKRSSLPTSLWNSARQEDAIRK
jgi:hypothetical protein